MVGRGPPASTPGREPAGGDGPRGAAPATLSSARAIDRAEALPRPADHGDAALAEERQHVAAEDAGAVVM
jgi:hypothetical protein